MPVFGFGVGTQVMMFSMMLAVFFMTRWCYKQEPFVPIKPDVESVATQGPTTYTRKNLNPRFTPLASYSWG